MKDVSPFLPEVGTSHHPTLQERRAARGSLSLAAHRSATAARDWSNATTTSGEGKETWLKLEVLESFQEGIIQGVGLKHVLFLPPTCGDDAI